MSTRNARGRNAHPIRRGRSTKATATLACPGYATSLLLDYRRKKVKAPAWRIKEWDYYLVNDDEFAVALTPQRLGLRRPRLGFGHRLREGGLQDHQRGDAVSRSGGSALPETSGSGVSAFENARASLRFEAADGTRRLRALFRRFDGDEDLSFDAVLGQRTARFHGHCHAVGGRPAGVLLQPEDRGHARPRQPEEGPVGAWFRAGQLVWPPGLGAWRVDARQHVVLGRCPKAGRATGDAPRRVGLNLGGTASATPRRRPRTWRSWAAWPPSWGRVDFGIPEKRPRRTQGGRPVRPHGAVERDRRRRSPEPDVHAAARPHRLHGLQADPLRPAPSVSALSTARWFWTTAPRWQ